MKISLDNIDYFFQSESFLGAGQVTADHVASLSQQGIESIINIRGLGEDDFSEIEQACKSHKLQYHHIPFFDQGELSIDQMNTIAKTLEENPKALIHCKSSNRVGAFYFYYFFKLKKLDREKSLELAKALGLLSLEQRILNFVDTP